MSFISKVNDSCLDSKSDSSKQKQKIYRVSWKGEDCNTVVKRTANSLQSSTEVVQDKCESDCIPIYANKRTSVEEKFQSMPEMIDKKVRTLLFISEYIFSHTHHACSVL